MKFKSEPGSFEPESGINSGKRTSTKAFCIVCQRRVNLITFDTAIIVLCVDPDGFLRLLEEGRIHRLHNSKGRILACLNSVRKAAAHRRDDALRTGNA
jgi:hypothetical protein